ncbi:helix-turn-helix domain-containing protein [uncultured Pseudodesulfovibrio sp.]|uniref:helix-turn-helix domain-containing protein n=1 Tax=uncultured Pseudodesulfovibrio sp. TaxID=2035858 RepID=UPI0029C7B912|nr:helix-turn-helix domain-containing protein [uncultured Pseudodesulfovibrio sp.]
MVTYSSDKDATKADAVVRRLVKASGVKNAAALADMLGISPQAISSAKKKGKIPLTWIEQVAEKSGQSLDWLLYGIENSVPGEGKTVTSYTLSQALADADAQKCDIVIAGEDGKRIYIQYVDPCNDLMSKQRTESKNDLLAQLIESIQNENEQLKLDLEKWQSKAINLMTGCAELRIELAKKEAEIKALRLKIRDAPADKESEGLQESA